MAKLNGSSKWSKSVSEAQEENRKSEMKNRKSTVTVDWGTKNEDGQVQMTTSDGSWNGTVATWVDENVAKMVEDAAS